MPLAYKEGRLQFVFNPSSKLAQLFVRYVAELEEAYYALLPKSKLQAIYVNFKREFDPEGITELSKEEFDRFFSSSIALDDLVEYPAKYEQIGLEAYGLLKKLYNRLASREDSDFTLLDKYREFMFVDIAMYLRERLSKTIEVLSQKHPQESSKKMLDAKQRLSHIKEGLEDAVLIFKSQNGQVYMHDRRKEPTYRL